jgi:glycerol-3-phosphate dehydrogenase (NAD(P)+)
VEKIVFNSGAFGNSISSYVANLYSNSSAGPTVVLYDEDPGRVESYKNLRTAERPYPDFKFPKNLNFSSSPKEAYGQSDLIFVTFKMQELYERLQKEVFPYIRKDAFMVLGSKGLSKEKVSIEIVRDIAPSFFDADMQCAVLGGAMFSRFLVSETFTITAGVLGSRNGDLVAKLQKVFSSDRLRFYVNDDPVGVAMLGALKNVYALGAGLIHQIDLGGNAVSFYKTRAFAEFRRLAKKLKIHDDVIFGLAGYGDFDLSCSSMISRNCMLGALVAQENDVKVALEKMKKERGGEVAEGYYTLPFFMDLARKFDVNVHIANQIYMIFYQGKPPRQGAIEIMQLPLQSEIEGK